MDLLEQDAPLPDQAAEQRRARVLLDRFLSSIPEDLATAFVLFELEGLERHEVAELLGIPMGTAASRLRRAREAFQKAVHVLTKVAKPGDAR